MLSIFAKYSKTRRVNPKTYQPDCNGVISFSTWNRAVARKEINIEFILNIVYVRLLKSKCNIAMNFRIKAHKYELFVFS